MYVLDHIFLGRSEGEGVDGTFKLREVTTSIARLVYGSKECARRGSGNCSNDMNGNGLERGDFCASFEPYSNLVSGVVFMVLACSLYSFARPIEKGWV